MDRLINTAIIGTGQIPTISLETDSPIDEIIEQLSEESQERQLLLAAGAISIAHRAGYVATYIPEGPVAAEAEERSYCSSKIAIILEDLLQKRQEEQLLEALQLVGKANLILLPNLLTLALNSEQPQLQALFYPLLGKRGLWLSQFQQQWNWVKEYERGERAADTQGDEIIQLTAIAKQIKQAESDELLRTSIGHKEGWDDLLIHDLPRPWSKTFSNFFLQQLAEYLQKTEHLNFHLDPWYKSLFTTALAIHPDTFQQAIEVSKPLKNKSGEITAWNKQFKRFREIVQTRKEIRQEITR